MLNVVVLMGRLTKDPELRTTSTGLSTCRFTVAVDRSYVKPGEERKADFISCTAWRQTAEFISKYFTKGQMIAIEGSIQTGSYTNREGATVYTTDVIVNSASFTGSKRESGGSSYTGSGYQGGEGGYQPAPQRTQTAPAPASYSSGSASDFVPNPLEDDLPF